MHWPHVPTTTQFLYLREQNDEDCGYDSVTDILKQHQRYQRKRRKRKKKRKNRHRKLQELRRYNVRLTGLAELYNDTPTIDDGYVKLLWWDMFSSNPKMGLWTWYLHCCDWCFCSDQDDFLDVLLELSKQW